MGKGIKPVQVKASKKSVSDGINAIILAAGYATRLYPLTLNIPKPLLKITPQKTVIDFIVDDLEKTGKVKDISVVTNSKFYKNFVVWAKGRKRSNLSVINDGTHTNDDRRGAIGDIYFAVKNKKVSTDFIVVGGDNLFDKGLTKFLSFATSHRPWPSLGLFDIKSKKNASRFGVVSIDAKAKVRHFEEKPKKPKSTLLATCLYYFPKETLVLLEKYIKDKTTSKDAPGNYIHWLLRQGDVYGHSLKEGHWYDIGHFDSYKEVVTKYNK